MSTPPDLSDYRVIHSCLRVAPHRMAAAVDGLAPGDRARAGALARYWRGFAGEVLVHHTIEDDIMFPRLVERVPVAAGLLDRVEGDHHRLDELMDEGRRALDRLSSGPDAASAEVAATALRDLARHMDSHLDFEDEDLVPLFGRHFTGEEYAQLTERARKHIGLGRQAAFTVPFVAYWASPDDRDRLLGEAPLALRALYRLTRNGHARLARAALGAAADPQAVAR
jgi:hemerythrin-like domain-containing protein